jgi:hypothetical protein
VASRDGRDFDGQSQNLSLDTNTARHFRDDAMLALVWLYSNLSGKHTSIALEQLRKLLTILGDAYVFGIVAKAAASVGPVTELSLSG